MKPSSPNAGTTACPSWCCPRSRTTRPAPWPLAQRSPAEAPQHRPLPAAAIGSTNAFQDRDLLILARAEMKAQEWSGQNPEYKKLHTEFQAPCATS
jgi:hypothetical protein